MSDTSDTELVKRFQSGDAAAFSLFSERHRDRLYRLAVVWVGSSDLAQDAVQETFIRSYKGIGKFRFKAAPSTWLYRVCRNVCLEIQRQHPAHSQLSDQTLEHLEAAPYREDVLPNYLRRALDSLPERQRDVVVLRLLEEYSVRDTASMMGCREGTVKANLSKALHNLRQNFPNQEFLDVLSK